LWQRKLRKTTSPHRRSDPEKLQKLCKDKRSKTEMTQSSTKNNTPAVFDENTPERNFLRISSVEVTSFDKFGNGVIAQKRQPSGARARTEFRHYALLFLTRRYDL
jgi:hypothetical protein